MVFFVCVYLGLGSQEMKAKSLFIRNYETEIGKEKDGLFLFFLREFFLELRLASNLLVRDDLDILILLPLPPNCWY